MTWQEIAEKFVESARQADSYGDYFGFEDAGYAYRGWAEAEITIARLCLLLESTGQPVPTWLISEPEVARELDRYQVIITETARGFWVRTQPEAGYVNSEGIYRKIHSLHTTREEAVNAADDAIETLKAIAEQKKSSSAVAQAEAHLGTKAVSQMQVISFGQTASGRPSKPFWNWFKRSNKD